MIEDTLDLIYDVVDDLALQGRFDVIDMILDQISIEYTQVVFLLGYMTATLPMSSKLKNRQYFVTRCIDKMIAQKYPPRTWEGLV